MPAQVAPLTRSHGARLRRRLALVALLLALLGALALGYRIWRITTGLRDLRAAIESVEQAMGAEATIDTLAQIGPPLRQVRITMADLRREAAPLAPAAGLLGWAPGVGGDLRSAGPLLDYGYHLAVAADEAHTALSPLASMEFQSGLVQGAMMVHLAGERERLAGALQAVAEAEQARRVIDQGRLSEPLRTQVAQADRLLANARDAIELALALPGLLGADGPREYLLLGQSPDELRATGGLITSAGLMTLQRGQLVEFVMQDAATVDAVDQSRYPDAPEPMRRYMASRQLLLRDANWSPDFPTAARAAIELYRLGTGREPASAIAFDTHAIRLLLAVLGSVTVEGVPYPLTPANLERELRTPYGLDGGAGREEFKRRLTRSLLEAVWSAADQIDVRALAGAMQRALDERHILIFTPDPGAAALFARHGWDGAVRPGDADFLMVVDTNVGYNKANPNIRQTLVYSVDLTNPSAPSATLTVRHEHLVPAPRRCVQWGEKIPAGQSEYESWLERCYWNYLRVLTPAGSELTASQALPTPAEWLMSGVADDGSVAPIAVEGGVAAFGVLVVVPTGETRETAFSYRLPESVVTRDGAAWRYRLRLQKQAGSSGVQAFVTLRLPAESELLATSLAPAQQGADVARFAMTLDRDGELTVDFTQEGGAR